MVEQNYRRGKYRVNYRRDKFLTALDSVFLAIDGKGTINGYKGDLYQGIMASADGSGNTPSILNLSAI